MQAYQYNHLHYNVQIICLSKIPLFIIFFFFEKNIPLFRLGEGPIISVWPLMNGYKGGADNAWIF